MTRERVVQQPPPDDLVGFPTRIHHGVVYRAARLSPWWFCGCGSCRFDLAVGPEQRQSTMYCSTDVITGVLETLGPEMLGCAISKQFLTERTVWALAYDRAVILADLVADDAFGFGVTNELSSMVPYALPQMWAEAFHNDGLDGISYRTRFNPSDAATGVALFDEAGGHVTWPAQRVCSAADSTIVAELRRRHVAVEAPPALASLTLL